MEHWRSLKKCASVVDRQGRTVRVEVEALENVDKRSWYFLTALAFGLHNVEEAAAAPRMLELMQSRAPMFLRSFYTGIQVSELRTSLIVLTVVALLLATAASRAPGAPGWSYTMLLFCAVIGLNALAHVSLSIAFGTYMPGLITALVLTLPVSVAVLVRGWRDRWVLPSAYWTILPAAVVVHGPVLAVFIRTTISVFRVFIRGAA
jgi:Protein of unknown function with HXXEE motif